MGYGKLYVQTQIRSKTKQPSLSQNNGVKKSRSNLEESYK